MVREKFAVKLTAEERDRLEHLVRAGRSPARVATRARILLKTSEGWSAPKVAQALDVAESSVYRIKRRFAEDGLEGVLQDRLKPTGTSSWMTGPGLISSPWPAPWLPRGMTTGRYAPLRAGRWSWEW